MILRDIVRDLFSAALHSIASQQAGPDHPRNAIEARVENTRDERFGDFACTSAMDNRLRDLCGIKNPRELATRTIDALRSMPASTLSAIPSLTLLGKTSIDQIFEKIEVAGAGFINVTLHRDFLYSFVLAANQSPDTYGRSQAAEPRNIIFEFVSANPTGPLNVVSARSAALGDSCCNLLEATGENVHREFYVNDYGNQVRLLGISCLFRSVEMAGVPLKFARKAEDDATPAHATESGIPFPAEAYHGEYVKEVVSAIRSSVPVPQTQVDRLKKLAIRTDLAEADVEATVLDDELRSLADTLGRSAINRFLETQQRDLAEFRVPFHRFFRESSLHESGAVLAVAEKLKQHVYTEQGKQIFRSTDFADDKDRVIVRDDGRPTYLLADIAYHETKIDRGFSHIFDIWGPDHHGYIARLAGAMQALGFPEDRFRVLIAQQVNLLEGGQPVVMSKRTGKIITLRELMEELPLDVMRYFFVMRSFEAHLDFDLAEARDTSEKNPYYYVAYAHARIRSIVAKAMERNLVDGSTPDTLPANLDLSEERRRLLLHVARFPEEVREAARGFEPHRLILFLYQTANALSRFYGLRSNKIIDLDPQTAAVLLAILQAVAVCLKRGLGLLGMQAPDRMEREIERQDAEN